MDPIIETGLTMARILAVDDETELLGLAQEILEGAGHSVECVDNGRDALEKLKAETFDLLLTDIMMPDIDGIELIRTAQPNIAAGMKVLAISGGGDRFPGSYALSLAEAFGAETKLFKPFSGGELRDAVEAALNGAG